MTYLRSDVKNVIQNHLGGFGGTPALFPFGAHFAGVELIDVGMGGGNVGVY